MRETKRNLKEALELVLEVNRERVEHDRPKGTAIRAKIRI